MGLLALSTVASSQSPDQSQWVEPSLNGLPLGTVEALVLEELGEPKEVLLEPAEDVLGMGPTKLLKYSSLEVGLHQEVGSDVFCLWRFELNGGEWLFSSKEVQIGHSREQVREALGEPESISERETAEVWHYPILRFDGWSWLVFHDDVLVEIGATEDWT